MDIACLDFREIAVQDLSHWRTGNVGALLRQATISEIAAGMLAVSHIHVADDVHNTTVRLLRKALVLAAVARFHMEYGDVQPLRADHAQAGVRVAQDENRVRTGLDHQLVGCVDDVTHCRAEIITNCIHIDFWLSKFEVAEEDAVEIVVVVLSGVGEKYVEILSALCDDRCQPDNFRASPHYD